MKKRRKGAIAAPRSGALKKRKRNRKWKRHPQDWYVEPTWCNALLFKTEQFDGKVWDPACGIRRILKAAEAEGLETVGSDLVDRGGADHVENFLQCQEKRAPNIVTNAPFRLAQQFVEHALQLADRKVVVLLPAAWVQGQRRSRWLEKSPLRRVYFIAPRPSMPPGPVVMAGHEPSNGLSDFAFYVWLKGYDGPPEIRWLRRDDGAIAVKDLRHQDRVQFMGPDQLARADIAASGKLVTPAGLPLFKNGKTVTRDRATKQEAQHAD